MELPTTVYARAGNLAGHRCQATLWYTRAYEP
jgi:hypothetical protein